MGKNIILPNGEKITVPNFRRLSTSSQNAIFYAEGIRRRISMNSNRIQIFTELILLGMLFEKDSPTRVIFECLDLSVSQFQSWLYENLQYFSKHDSSIPLVAQLSSV